MELNINNGSAILFQIQDLNTQANFCEKYFLSSIHQKVQLSRRNGENIMWR